MKLIDADDLIFFLEKDLKDFNTMVSEHGQGIAHGTRLAIERVAGQYTIDPENRITGDTSDGYHTFNELYHHRAVLFAAICNTYPHLAWKSKQHHKPDEPMYDEMFIAGIETPQGQATYHFDIEPYWDMFHVRELERAPRWDGHTPEEAAARIVTIDPESLPTQWIPFTWRETTDDDGFDPAEFPAMACGELPENGQDILVTNGEHVWSDTFFDDDGCYLDSGNELFPYVTAWMPLPEPYHEPAQNGECEVKIL